MKMPRMRIIRNSDGQRRIVRTDYSRFWWEDGNGACDCNRHTEFERVADPDYSMAPQYPCGSTEYSIEFATKE